MQKKVMTCCLISWMKWVFRKELEVFDPFGDYDTRGYLQNFYALKRGAKLDSLEQIELGSSLPSALSFLSKEDIPDYNSVLKVHNILFQKIYPWAGKDRLNLDLARYVSKGDTYFAPSYQTKMAFEYAMRQKTFGKKLGQLAYSHPFLDGNGRALFAFFDDHLRRNGALLDWASLKKDDFLRALDAQLNDPESEALDSFLDPFLEFKNKIHCNEGSTIIKVTWVGNKKSSMKKR